MTKEFKKTTKGRDVVYTLESVSSGGTGSGSVATSVGTKKGSGLLVQDTQPSVVRRNPVAKNVNKASSGAGVHKDRKKAMKRGEIKHKKPFAEEGVAEAGPFSYGKPPRKGSVADLTAKKRKEQERGQHPIEPKDQQVGVAKVTKGVAEESIDHEKIYGINLEPFIDYVKRKSGKLGAAKAMDNVKYSLEVYHNKQGEELNKILNAVKMAASGLGERRMSRAAKGVMKYGKDGMKALAKAGREGASEKKLDSIRNKHDHYNEEWSQKYKNSINCSHPKGFSQRAHCAGKKKHNESTTMEMICPECGMCQTHGNLDEIKKGQKDSNGYTKCWPGKHAEGTKKGKNGGRVRNCVPNENLSESHPGNYGFGASASNTVMKTKNWQHSAESSDKEHTGEENGMMTSALKSLYKHAIKLRHAVKQMQVTGQTLEPWQQAKVTKAADYLDTVFNAVDDDFDLDESEYQNIKKEDGETHNGGGNTAVANGGNSRPATARKLDKGRGWNDAMHTMSESYDDDDDHQRKVDVARKQLLKQFGGPEHRSPEEKAHGKRNKEILRRRSQERIRRIKLGLPGANSDWQDKDDKFNLDTPIPNVADNPARVNPPDEIKPKRFSEAPIEMDPTDPMNPKIHSHQGVNPSTLKARMMRAKSQLNDLVKKAESGTAMDWESIARHWSEISVNIEQIRHALDELAKVRKKGGIRSRGIDPYIGPLEEELKALIRSVARPGDPTSSTNPETGEKEFKGYKDYNPRDRGRHEKWAIIRDIEKNHAKIQARKDAEKTAIKKSGGHKTSKATGFTTSNNFVGGGSPYRRGAEESISESKLNEKSTTEKQARTMAAAAHNPKFAKKLGIKQSVAKEFNKADKGTKKLSNAMKHKKNEGYVDPYMEELKKKLGEKVLQPNDPVEKYVDVFQKANYNQPGNYQFGKYNPENRTPQKRERMANAASYAAKTRKKK